MTSLPDRVVELQPALCEKCSGSLVEHAGEAGMERRQVMDTPPPSGLETTEYRAISLRCAECGEVTKPAFPQWAKAPVQYGPRLHARANYLAVRQYMPFERMAELFHDDYGVEISVGTLVAMVKRGGERVQPALEEIKGQLQRAAVVNVDETGCHVAGKLKWVHGAATEELTLLGVDDHRGVDGIKGLGVLDEMTGIVIHDAWPAYWNVAFEKVSGHGLCNAHHLRELLAVTDFDGQRWSERMTNLLLEMLAKRNAGHGGGPDWAGAGAGGGVRGCVRSRDSRGVAGERQAQGQAAAEQGRQPAAEVGGAPRRSAPLPARLRGPLHEQRDRGRPPNDQAAREDLRGLAFDEGASAFLAVRGYLATARKQGQGWTC